MASSQPCPDPSAHQHSNHSKISEQASSAALRVSQSERNTETKEADSVNPLGPDGKLSAKGAATSLKYAKAQDLPSFPSRGTAADSASKAALLAKDYKMKDLWHPEASNAASKASLLAARDGGKVDLWHATPNAASNSAATLAMKNKGLSPEIDRGYTADGQSKALLAATQSHNQSQRKRADSIPVAPPVSTYPDQENSIANALNAATVSHRNSKMAPDGWDSEANQAARIKNIGSHMDPKMFTEHPPVEIEQEEKRHQAALRASAISMAKQMYDVSQKQTDGGVDLRGGREGAETAHARRPPSASTDVRAEAMRYINLQDAAHKLAQERLAKVDKNLEASRYREYYGYPDESSSKKPLNRLSIRSKGRNRASSNLSADLEDSSDDEEQARRIRGQMSQLSSGLNSVDEKKRADDRARLMAAAEKRVHAQMHDMDERVFMDTGKVTPAMMEEWETKARQKVQEEKQVQATHAGKTHVGGGKYIDQAELEAIAQARLKPTLDEINESVEKKRARDEQIRQEKEEQERIKREEKQHHREEKEERNRIKNEEKAAAKKEKEEQKAIKEEEKARLEAEKRAAKEEKRKSREQKRESTIASSGAGAIAGLAVEDGASRREDAELVQPDSRADRRSGVFSRFSTRLKRSGKKADDDEKLTTETTAADSKASQDAHRSAAAAALTGGTAAAAVLEHEHENDKHSDDFKDITPVPGGEDTGDLSVEGLRLGGELQPTTSGIEFGHSGDYTDAIPTPAAEIARPNLERHITTVETSDEEEEDNAEESRIRGRDASLTKPAETVAAVAVAAPLVASTEKSTEYEPPIPAASTQEVQPAEVTREPVSPITAEETHAEKTAVRPLDETVAEPGPAPISTHTEEVTKAKSPEVSPLEEDSKQTAAVLSPVTDASKEVSTETETSNLASEEPVSSLGRPIAGRGGGVGIAAYDGPSTRGDTGPAPNTIGPHKSDIANILDPRVKPDPSKMKERGTAGPHKSDLLNILDPRVESDPVKAEQKAQQESTKLQKKQVDPEVESGEKKKGLRGFLDKLKHKPSRSENKLSKQPDSQEKSGTIGGAPYSSTDEPATTGVSETASRIPEIVEHGSPSSFQRLGQKTNDVDDVSSSGLDEDDLARGRTGGASRRALTADDRRTSAKNELQPTTTNNEDEQFEEARDHFDEALAPPPAFAGQGKSQSPVRGTKFQEVGL